MAVFGLIPSENSASNYWHFGVDNSETDQEAHHEKADMHPYYFRI